MAGNTLQIKLVSTAGTGEYYTVRKSRMSGKPAKKLVLKKYDKKVKKHVDFKEDKIK